MRKAFFITEREAREWIAKEFGEDVVLKPDSFTDGMLNGCEVDEYPYSWCGESAAFDVNFGEACVGFWESGDITYQVVFKSGDNVLSFEFDALCRAREAADKIDIQAEGLNVAGEIIIKNDFEIIDEIQVEHDNDERKGSFATLKAILKDYYNL